MSILDNSTMTAITKMLDVALVNQALISNNIANINTTGFKVSHIDFDQQLRQLESVLSSSSSTTSLSDQIESIQPVVLEQLDPTSLDAEVALLAKNMVNYQTLIEARSELSALLKIAIHGGSR